MPLVAGMVPGPGSSRAVGARSHRSGSLVVPVCAGDLVCCGHMVIIPCAYSRPRDEILWRHAAMVEAGLSETGGVTGALGKAASRVVPDPMLGFITSRLCIGWPRGDARGSFHSYSARKTGSLATETPRLPGRSAVCFAA